MWFDVGIKRYTTARRKIELIDELWFDVGIKRYTTNFNMATRKESCGLM